MNPLTWLREQAQHRARAREYDCVMKVSALLGQDAGEEMYYFAHEGDAPPKPPSADLWMRFETDMPAPDRHTAMLFNAQMSFAIGRAEGFAEAFRIDVMDKAFSALRDAA